MCGVAGFLMESKSSSSVNFDLITKKMTDSIKHRGPNDSGCWNNPCDGIALGHRRLSILDLSDAGHQPMESSNGRYVIAFNGEIYNHLQIRSDIEKNNKNISWRGHSDTETILSAFETFGIQNSLEKFVGMFAFSLWDKKNKILTLARDRLGEKPMYYGWQNIGNGRAFLFGSELKALKSFPDINLRVDRGSLSLFLKHAYVPNPYSIYENIFSLEPGQFLQVSLSNRITKTVNYWDASEIIKKGSTQEYKGTPKESVKDLKNLLRHTIKSQMISDVPLGAFLSGGIDSSTVVSIMQEQSDIPAKTFTIGFNEKGFDEAKYAKSIADHLGTDHTELYINANDAMKVIPDMHSIYCEPFADSTQIPNFIVSKLANNDVTVALSGDGGDELFGGYSRYNHIDSIWKKINYLPLSTRNLISKILKYPLQEKSLYSSYKSKTLTNLSKRIISGTNLIDSETIHELYLHVITQIPFPEEVVREGYLKDTKLDVLKPNFGDISNIEKMMATDTVNYLPDDILTKVDRAAMRTSLETRVPFLDHNIVEFAYRLPISYKVKEGESKWPLQQILKDFLPESLTKREKMGFSVPIHEWIRGPLREWCEELLKKERLKSEGFFNEEIVCNKWEAHLCGRENNITFLWPVLMFQSWLENQ
tara:strand:+ start:9576 stop:11519 length:1944 start_codon:yes stop_codon:yes gene_type:complete